MKMMNNRFPTIEQVTNEYLYHSGKSKDAKNGDGVSFQEILQKKQQPAEEVTLKFSKHASTRLADRNIDLSLEQLDRLNAGARKADAKGINESLVLVDQLAFIVNVKNNTVVTAMDQAETSENIFTNIDGAVII